MSRVDYDRAWVVRIALSPNWRRQGLGSALLAELEHRLLAAGVSRISALLPECEAGSLAFVNSGFRSRGDLTYFEKTETVSPRSAMVLNSLGGAVPPARMWDRIAGMSEGKTLIERRVVLPLSHPEVAAEHGVRPPSAVVLFGPPGTGKTTFARAVASRLGWPFVELFPSRLATSEVGLASGLNEVFDSIAELEHVLVFIDEVEEIAAARRPSTASVAIVNELLKSLMAFRERPGRLLVCATNSVRVLDAAFLRHGRFDYVLPIGSPTRLPDAISGCAISALTASTSKPWWAPRTASHPPTSNTPHEPSRNRPSRSPWTPATVATLRPETSWQPSPTSARP